MLCVEKTLSCAAIAHLAFAGLAPLVAQGSGGERAHIVLENTSAFARVEWSRASVPFEKGTVREPIPFHVEGQPTAWRPLQRWPDGSIRVAQAQFMSALQGYERRELRLLAGSHPVAPFALHPAVAAASDFTIATVVYDIDGVPYTALAQPLRDASATVLEQTGAVTTLRLRTYHDNAAGAGIGRDFTSQTSYVTLFSGLPYAVVDVVVANDYRGADNPQAGDPNELALGDVAFSGVELYTAGAQALVRYPQWNGVGPHVHGVLGPASTFVQLLPAGYFADGQGKRWRIVLQFDDPSSPGAEQDMWRETATAVADAALIPLTDHGSWDRADAFGVHGGPVPPPHDALQRAQLDYDAWLATAEFGPFGSWGDMKPSFAGGTPRNGPVTELGAHAMQTGFCLPALQLEAMAWQQTLRPYHLWGLRVEPADDIYLWEPLPYSLTSTRRVSQETLGRHWLQQNDPWAHWRQGVPLGRAHGWSGYDAEHFTIDLLFDYWTLTGDHRAYDEIVNLAESAMGILRSFKYASQDVLPARAEGWIAQALVKAWFVTGDDRYITHLRHRIANIVEPGRHQGHPGRALFFEPGTPHTPFPDPHEFYMAWQHASVVYGYTPVWKHFGDQTARRIANDVVYTVAHSWVTNYPSATFGWVPQGLRYQTPVSYQGALVPPDIWDFTPGVGAAFGTGPLTGSAMFLVGALDLIREDTESVAEADLAFRLRTALLFPGADDDAWRWFRWCFLRESPTR